MILNSFLVGITGLSLTAGALTSIQPSVEQKNHSITDDKIRSILIKLNEDFAAQENSNPAKGYCVQIETTPSLKAVLIPRGGPRKEEQLSGMPKNESTYIEECPFCEYARNNLKDPRILKIFENDSYAVTSLSNQVLVIPEEHYSHWFTIPIEKQMELLQNILEIRDVYASTVQRPIEFHCGSAAGQTVFHFHGRTGFISTINKL